MSSEAFAVLYIVRTVQIYFIKKMMAWMHEFANMRSFPARFINAYNAFAVSLIISCIVNVIRIVHV